MVGTSPAVDVIISSTTDQHVIVNASVKFVVAITAIKDVIVIASVKFVVAITAIKDVVVTVIARNRAVVAGRIWAAADCVIALPTLQLIVTGLTVDLIVPISTINFVARYVVTGQMIIVFRSGDIATARDAQFSSTRTSCLTKLERVVWQQAGGPARRISLGINRRREYFFIDP